MTSKQLRNKLRREKKKNENKMKKKLIAVYGNLRKGCKDNYEYLRHSEYLGVFESLPEYKFLDIGNYPALIKGSGSVIIEVYEVSEQSFNEISEYECCFNYNSTTLNDKYSLTKQEKINTPFGEAVIFMYSKPEDVDHAPVITNGDWCDYLILKKINKLIK